MKLDSETISLNLVINNSQISKELLKEIKKYYETSMQHKQTEITLMNIKIFSLLTFTILFATMYFTYYEPPGFLLYIDLIITEKIKKLIRYLKTVLTNQD